MQTIRIEIEDCGNYARCQVPFYGDLYGRTVEELAQTLDMMSEAGAFCNLIQLEI